MANIQPAFPHVVLNPTATGQRGLETVHGDQGSSSNQAAFESQPNIILSNSSNSSSSGSPPNSPASVLLPGDMACNILATDLLSVIEDMETVATVPETPPAPPTVAYHNALIWTIDYSDTPMTSPGSGDEPETRSDTSSEHVPTELNPSADTHVNSDHSSDEDPHLYSPTSPQYSAGSDQSEDDAETYVGEASEHNFSDSEGTYISSRRSAWASQSDVASDGYDGGSESYSGYDEASESTSVVSAEEQLSPEEMEHILVQIQRRAYLEYRRRLSL